MFIGIKEKWRIILLALILLFCFTSCKDDEISSSFPESTDTHYLVFSKEKYQAERLAIKEWYSEDYAAIRAVQGENYIEHPIYITKFDLDIDGTDELIVAMIGALWGGVSGGEIVVMDYDGSKITNDIHLANFRIDYDNLDKEGNRQIGVKLGDKGYYDFIVFDDVWAWREE